MSRAISEIENPVIRDLLVDMGFPTQEEEPGWAYDLAERLAEAGWRKNPLTRSVGTP